MPIFGLLPPTFPRGALCRWDRRRAGAHPSMAPSQGTGWPRPFFTDHPAPPILESSVPGTTFKLETKRIGSISLGSPIFYRDIEVGTVLGWDLADMARHVTIHAFIRAPFDKYLHDDSLFLDPPRISIKLPPNPVK